MNDAGQVVGYVRSSLATPRTRSAGRRRAAWSILAAPGRQPCRAGVNDVGQVAGFSTTAARPHAFLWTPAGGMVDLGTLGGSDQLGVRAERHGQVVGDSTTATGEPHAFSWTQAGGMVDLGTLGGPTSTVADVNDSGEVVGFAVTGDGAITRYCGATAPPVAPSSISQRQPTPVSRPTTT